MLPLFNFGDNEKKRRKMNLGGSSSVSSSAAILVDARARREEREETRRRHDSAVRLQAWWRGTREVRAVRRGMRGAFERDITTITGLRCLVLMRGDEEALALWSNTFLSLDQGALFRLAQGSNRDSWTTLVRQASYLLICSVANFPSSPNTVAHLRILNTLCSRTVVSQHLGSENGQAVSDSITRYLVEHGLYDCLARAITAIPLEKKDDHPALPLIVPLIIAPFSNMQTTSDATYLRALSDLVTGILTIPLLPNHFPLHSLTALSSGLPIASLSYLEPLISTLVASLTVGSCINLIANMLVFTQPRYAKLTRKSMDVYLLLLTALFNALPANALTPPTADGSAAPSAAWSTVNADSDDEDDEDGVSVSVVSAFSPPSSALPPPPTPASKLALQQLDAKTLKRLSVIPTPTHLQALLDHPNRMRLAEFVFALNAVWPAQKGTVLSACVAKGGGRLVSELYRQHVRRSKIGKDHHVGALVDSDGDSWLPLVFLADVYTQALLTMGDDEFFSSNASSSVTVAAPRTAAARNPLTLDELTSFSRQLLNIAFALYWREDQAGVSWDGAVKGDVVSIKLERVREIVTRCLVAIHARDSRKPFTPPDHWLVSSQIDMSTFVEAAVYEEQQLQPEGSGSSRPLSKRQVAYISPRLGVLNNIPFAIPFETRVMMFRQFVANDMVRRFGGTGRRMMQRRWGGTRVTVRRGMVAQDGFDKLSDADLKGTIEITFVDQFGQPEAGIDGGGVFKEFLTSLCKEVFDTDHGLWLATKKNELYPNPHAYATEPHSLSWYRFIGRILGKAVYEGILVDVAFAGFFLAKWLGRQSFLDDLASLDLDLYRGLIFLKHYEGNPEDLSLNFTVGVEDLGVAKTVDLLPGGSNIAVTKENRLPYIHLVSRYRLVQQIKLQSEAFFDGLSEMIDSKWLRMFNQQELQILLGGVDSPVDLEDLQHNTSYGGLYDIENDTIQAFWKVVGSFNQEQRRALLRFVTSCSRPPLLGFKELVPNFAIRDAGADEHRLPTASTCVNLLKLPRYKSEVTLRDKLLQAITSNAGFDLS